MQIRDIPCVDYLQMKGYKIERRGNKWFTNSPFRNERTPSFCIFPDNAWVDFGWNGSGPKSGNVITLAKHFGDDLRDFRNKSFAWKPPAILTRKAWNGMKEKFIDLSTEERNKVMAYAESRGIVRGYANGCFFTKTDTGFDRHLAILFPHQDSNGTITGAKFRALEQINGQRFSSSGQLGFYVLENIKDSFEEPVFYLIEGEANANSLWEHCRNIGKSCVVASAGGVTSVPKELPHKYAHLKGKIMIDFDDSESSYQERLSKYVHLGLEPVKLILPKGQDLNSLYCSNDIKLINHLL